MNAQRAVRSILAAIPLAGFLILDFFPNLVFLKENSSGWVIVAIYPQSQIAAAGPSLIPASDGTGTSVITPAPGTGSPTRYDITGGTPSRDLKLLWPGLALFQHQTAREPKSSLPPRVQGRPLATTLQAAHPRETEQMYSTVLLASI